MEKRSFKSLLEGICNDIKGTRTLSGKHVLLLSKYFGKRGKNAIKAIKEGRVKKYTFLPSGRIVWILAGRECDYYIIPTIDFCTCNDFFFRVVGGEAAFCYHLIAQKLAEALEKYEKITESDEYYEQFITEWRALRELE